MSRSFAVGAVVFGLITILLFSSQAPAADHVVSTTALQGALSDAAASRQAKISRIEAFFSSTRAQKALRVGRLNLKEVKQAIPALSDQELAQLTKETKGVQDNFAAGALTNEELTYIVIALATAIVVILIVKA